MLTLTGAMLNAPPAIPQVEDDVLKNTDNMDPIAAVDTLPEQDISTEVLVEK